MSESFVDLLYADAPRAAYDELLARLGEGAAGEHARALQLRERLDRHRIREAELSALNDTANDLTRMRDLDTVLIAIVRRARLLLGADMTYLSLNDEREGASYMKVTDGALTPEFRQLRLPLGTGLLGLVAQTGEPYFTEDYQSDQRFVHREYIDTAVEGERIRAILGVPLVVEGQVIGALLAVHRTVRPFPPREVTLLTSFAAHAAVALENARLFDEARGAVARADEANRLLQTRSESVEHAARAHDRLTDVLVRGGGVEEIATVLGQQLRGDVSVHVGDEPDELAEAVREARASGRSVEPERGTYVAAAAAGGDHLGTLVVRCGELEQSERRTLERAAIVTALVLLFERTQTEAEERVRGELLTDLVSDRDLDEALLRARALRQGADLDRESCVAVALLPATDGAELHTAARTAARLAQERRGLSALHEETVVLLAGAEDPLALGHELHRRLGGIATVGVAAAAAGRAGVLAAYQEARQCALTLVALGRDQEVSAAPGLGVARLVLGTSGPGELADFVTATLGPVLAYDAERDARLTETLAAWFASGGSLKATGEALHVHPNTVGQRLERVAGLLGDDWRDPPRALDLQLALRVHALRSGI
jgi:GAF domain-containing protein